jgi:superoxide dismutase, Cu-Zn family
VIVPSLPDNFGNIPSRYLSGPSLTPGPDASTLATGDSGARAACGAVAVKA